MKKPEYICHCGEDMYYNEDTGYYYCKKCNYKIKPWREKDVKEYEKSKKKP